MANNIPNPLRSGTYTLPAGDSYTGDVGSYRSNTTDPATLDLTGGDTVVTTVYGLGDTLGSGPNSSDDWHKATINVAGSSNTLSITQIGGAWMSPYGPGSATINLLPGSDITGTYGLKGDGFLDVTGSGTISNANLFSLGGKVTIGEGVTLSGGSYGQGGDPHNGDPTTTINGAVDSGSFALGSGELNIEKPRTFHGAITLQNYWDGRAGITLAGEHATSYSWDGNKLHLFVGHADVYNLKMAFDAPGDVYQAADGVHVVDHGVGVTGQLLPEHTTGDPTVPVGPANFVLHNKDDDASQTSVASGHNYDGPVAGLQSELITLNPDNLQIAAVTPNVFIHSGSGDDAISVASSGGSNVLDGGTGSNFMTGGSGNDTFFNDARGATTDIWNTIVNFHPGDANTLWGVTSAGYDMTWAPSEGAGGYQGLTLHATPKSGGPIISTTFAGYSASDIGRLSVSENDQSNYTYITTN